MMGTPSFRSRVATVVMWAWAAFASVMYLAQFLDQVRGVLARLHAH